MRRTRAYQCMFLWLAWRFLGVYINIQYGGWIVTHYIDDGVSAQDILLIFCSSIIHAVHLFVYHRRSARR